MTRHAWCLVIIAAAACKGEPSAPPLDKLETERMLSYMHDERASEPRRLLVDPDRARLYDLVESGLLAKDIGWCVIDFRKRNPDAGRLDIILVAKVVPGGAASVALFFDQLDRRSGPVLDKVGTECARKELGGRPFPGVDKNAIGDADHALVAFRWGLRPDR